MVKKPFGRRHAHQPKQRCASENFDPGPAEHRVDAARFVVETHTHDPVDDARGNAEALLAMKAMGLKIAL